jgi:predicted membrane-bound dolichyl-phosphate-mannose-protein mannosyltransferase
MGTTTFSGPVKAGTIKDTTGTTLGSDVKNVGFVVMAQSAIADIIGASHLNQVIATIPANSQITDVVLNVTTVNNDSGAATVSVGTIADANAFIDAANVKALGTTYGTLDTEATDIGTTDIQVVADFTGASGDATTGAATVTVKYLQNNSIALAGDVPA